MPTVRKLDVPVFTNRGFTCFDMHDYVDKVKEFLPKMHPIGLCVIYGYLKEMHKAFDEYDMKRFTRLQHLVNHRIHKELQRATEFGDQVAEDEMRRYFTHLSLLISEMK